MFKEKYKLKRMDMKKIEAFKMSDDETLAEEKHLKRIREDSIFDNNEDSRNYFLSIFNKIEHNEHLIDLFLDDKIKINWIKKDKDNFLLFTSNKWNEVDSNTFRNKMSKALSNILDECWTDDFGRAVGKLKNEKHYKHLKNKFGNLNSIVNMLPVDNRKEYDCFNKAKNIILFDDGNYYDMIEKTIKPLKFDIKMTNEIPFSSDAIECVDDEFVSHYFESLFNCKETAQNMVDIIYTAISGNRMRYLIALWGKGRNGKSIMLNALFNIFGNWCGAISEKVFIEKKLKSTHNDELVAVCEKRIGYFSEPPNESTLCEETIKRITGGDQLSIRDLGKSTYSAEPTATLFLACNDPPKLTEKQAIQDRLLTFHFCNRFKKSLEYEENLKKKYPEILSYILRKGKIIDNVDFTGNMEKAKDYINLQSDIIEQYILESGDYEKCEDGVFNQADFKRDIHDWAKHNNNYKNNFERLKMKNIYEALENKGYTLQARTKAIKNPRIGLKRTDNANEDDLDERWG